MITSKDNEKLRLVRRLRLRKHRDREGLFVTDGEDLVAAGFAAGERPHALLTAPGTDLGGTEVDPELLAAASALGSGTRAIAVWGQRWSPVQGPVCAYLHAVADPANVGAVLRSFHALADGTVVLGPGCADPFSPKAVRASMGSIFGQAVTRGTVDRTPMPRVGLVARGGEPLGALAAPLTICLGSERGGLPPSVLDACERRLTIAVRPGAAESLNVAAAAAIALERISSAAAEGSGRDG